MSLGAGLIWTTVILVTVYVLYAITKNKRWRTVGKVSLVLVFIGVLIGAGVWGWFWYQDRPQVLTGLDKISFGMTPVDVTLALGKPDEEEVFEKEKDGNLDKAFTYRSFGSVDYYVRFSGQDGEGYHVALVCRSNYTDVFGLGINTEEQKILSKIGNPTNVSIREDGLAKIISYEYWKVGFVLQKGAISQICATDSGKLNFANEYHSDAL